MLDILYHAASTSTLQNTNDNSYEWHLAYISDQ